jgi:hypothetical protein
MGLSVQCVGLSQSVHSKQYMPYIPYIYGYFVYILVYLPYMITWKSQIVELLTQSKDISVPHAHDMYRITLNCILGVFPTHFQIKSKQSREEHSSNPEQYVHFIRSHHHPVLPLQATACISVWQWIYGIYIRIYTNTNIHTNTTCDKPSSVVSTYICLCHLKTVYGLATQYIAVGKFWVQQYYESLQPCTWR